MKKEAQYITITEYGDKFYYKDKAMTILHRVDGPAIEYAAGYKQWYVNGKLHRIDGPAIECVDGRNEWYINGKKLTEDEFFRLTDWREDQHIVDLRFLGDTLAFDIDSASDLLKTNALKVFRLLIKEMLEEAMKRKRANGFLG